MPVRQFRIYGQGYSDAGPVSVTLKFNGQTAFTGPVPTLNQTTPSDKVELPNVLLTWNSDTTTVGVIPVEISAAGGDVVVGLIEANYTGIGVGVDDVNDDHYIITIPPEDWWDDVNTNDDTTDGKTNVSLDNEPYGLSQSRLPGDTGDASFLVPENSTLSFDLFVDPAKTVTEPPPFPEVPPNDRPLPEGFTRPLPDWYVPYQGP